MKRRKTLKFLSQLRPRSRPLYTYCEYSKVRRLTRPIKYFSLSLLHNAHTGPTEKGYTVLYIEKNLGTDTPPTPIFVHVPTRALSSCRGSRFSYIKYRTCRIQHTRIQDTGIQDTGIQYTGFGIKDYVHECIVGSPTL